MSQVGLNSVRVRPHGTVSVSGPSGGGGRCRGIGLLELEPFRALEGGIVPAAGLEGDFFEAGGFAGEEELFFEAGEEELLEVVEVGGGIDQDRELAAGERVEGG